MGLSIQKFTNKAQSAVLAAQDFAHKNRHAKIEPEHLLLTLTEQEESVVAFILEKVGSHSELLIQQLNHHLDRLPKTSPGTTPYVSKRLQNVLQRSERESDVLQDSYTSCGHLLLGLLSERGSEATELLKSRNITRNIVLESIAEISGHANSPESEERLERIEKYCVDLINLARQGKLDPVIGRDEEVRRLIQVLSRRRKNNPVLIGDPGVGKTAIVEGLAQRIVSGDVPETLKNKRIFALDLGLLLAGAKFRGDFEDRLKSIIQQVENSNGQLILFVDEVHMLVGAGASDGNVDASNLLKPALSRGSMRCVGATTLTEYKKYIEKDMALERRFQQIVVAEPSIESTIAILRGLKEKYEVHHGIRIKDAAIIAATSLSSRYITDRFLPDKAIDLIDEASAQLCIEIDSIPIEIDRIERQIMRIEIEITALKADAETNADTLKKLAVRLGDLREKSAEKRMRWNKEREMIAEIRTLQGDIEKIRLEEQQAQRDGDLEKAARLRYGTLDEVNRKLATIRGQLNDLGAKRMLREAVDAEDIAAIVARWTGIPLERVLESERNKLLKMERSLSANVVGQNGAIYSISNAIRRSRAGIQDPNRPIGVFIFAGSTGVGKTELVNSLAKFLFDDEKSIIRIDMSEYMEKHSTARMIGAPPGYVGYEEGGILTEAVRRRPYSVILLDEVEKAHRDVFNLFLQIMDDGRLTDSNGRMVDFRNTVIILTTNIGQNISSHDNGTQIDEVAHKEATTQALQQFFRPEFLNRIDEVIVFNHLNIENIKEITRIQMEKLQRRLAGQQIEISLNEDAQEYLATKGYDGVFGARPLKRLIQKEIADVLAFRMLNESVNSGDKIEIRKSQQNDGLSFHRLVSN